MTNEDVIITSPNTIEAVIEAAGVVSVQLDKTGYTENEASVMAGKAAIAAAIFNKGIGANKNDSFSELSKKIDKMSNKIFPIVEISINDPNAIVTTIPNINITIDTLVE